MCNMSKFDQELANPFTLCKDKVKMDRFFWGGVCPMEQNTLLIQAKITPEGFREFALFDTMYRQKRYRSPLLFAAILAVFACICFSQQGRHEQAVLLGGVLLAVGLGLPLAYILIFLSSVNTKAKQLKLGSAPAAYTVFLSPEAVVVTAGEQRVEYAWEDIVYAYRIKRSTCLYVSPNRAYLLPIASQKEETERWSLVSVQLPPERRTDLRK